MLSKCSKIPYTTKSEAKKEAVIIRANAKYRNRMHKKHQFTKFKGVRLRAYLCRHCDKWHLTSKTLLNHRSVCRNIQL